MKLYQNGQWFSPLTSASLHEADLQDLARSKGHQIFPEFFVLPYHDGLRTVGGKVTPDLFLIGRDYECWWLVKTAVVGSDLETSVLPAVVGLKDAWSGDTAALTARLHILDPNLDVTKTTNLLNSYPHGVYVLVNETPPWATDLLALDIKIGILEVFRSKTGAQILRVNGYQPRTKPEDSLVCVVEPPNALRLESDRLLPQGDEKVYVHFGDSVALWRKVSFSGQTYLSPDSRFSLPDGAETVLLVKRRDGELEISVQTEKGAL